MAKYTVFNTGDVMKKPRRITPGDQAPKPAKTPTPPITYKEYEEILKRVEAKVSLCWDPKHFTDKNLRLDTIGVLIERDLKGAAPLPTTLLGSATTSAIRLLEKWANKLTP